MNNLISRLKGIFGEKRAFFSPSTLLTVFVIGVLVIFAFIFAYSQIKAFLINQDAKKPMILTIWGTRDDGQIIDLVAQGYEKLHPNVTVKYIQQSEQSYRTRTQTQIASGGGPDIVMFYNKWMPMMLSGKSLTPAPDTFFTLSFMKKTFYPIVASDLTKGGKVYGVPVDADGIVLFYNKQILQAQGLSAPQTWKQFEEIAQATTVKDPQTKAIVTSGAGLGLTSNVDYWSDLIGILFYQEPKTSLTTPDNDKGREVLNFFSKFAKDGQNFVWDGHFDSTTQAFEQGKLALYFAPLEKAIEIKQANPNLQFATTPLPQLTDDKTNAFYWARYLSYGVTASSKNPNQAWQFLQFLEDPNTQQYINEQEKNINGIGMPYARVDMQTQQSADPILGAFVTQGPGYRSWYLESNTGDLGLNDEMIKNYKGAVDGGNLSSTASNIPQILIKYGAYP